MEPEVAASIIAALTALVAVVAGPFFTFRAQKNQMLGPMRQDWINNLRNSTADFISHIKISRWHVVAPDSAPEEIRRVQLAEDRERIEKASQLKEKIALLINPKEVEHSDLLRLIESAYVAYHNGKDINLLAIAIRDQAQKVLKAEWNVVKK